MLGLIWVQTIGHSEGKCILERIFQKLDFEKNQQTKTKHENFVGAKSCM